MLRNIKKNYQSGFTIIEVLIVLAIAGLIMVAVFTAVPALQRSSRNSSQKAAGAQIMASISAYVANHNGVLPTTQTNVASAVADYKPGNILTANIYYSPSTTLSTAITSGSIGATGSATSITDTSAVFQSGVVCDATATNFTTTGASTRSYVLLYAIESGSRLQEECIGS